MGHYVDLPRGLDALLTGVSQHTKPTIVYLVTNPVSSEVANVFTLKLCLLAVVLSLHALMLIGFFFPTQ